MLKVLRVELAVHLGLIRSVHGVQPIPLNSVEERVRFDLGNARGAQPLVHVAQKTLDEVSGLGREGHLGGKTEVVPPVHDFPAGGHRLVAVKRGIPHQHLVHDGAHAPPVALEPVPFLQQHLRRYVIGRAHGAVREPPSVLVPVSELRQPPRRVRDGTLRLLVLRGRGAVLLGNLRKRVQKSLVHRFTQAKVAQFHVPVLVQQEVVGFDVSVDKVGRVDSLQRQHRLRDVEPRFVLRQGIAAHQQRHHVPARKVLHHQVEKLVVLEGVVQLHHRLVVNLRQEVTLSLDVVHLTAADHLRLFELLHGVDLPVRPVAHEPHLAESAAADDGERLKVIRGELGALQPGVLALLLVQLLQELLPGLHG